MQKKDANTPLFFIQSTILFQFTQTSIEYIRYLESAPTHMNTSYR